MKKNTNTQLLVLMAIPIIHCLITFALAFFKTNNGVSTLILGKGKLLLDYACYFIWMYFIIQCRNHKVVLISCIWNGLMVVFSYFMLVQLAKALIASSTSAVAIILLLWWIPITIVTFLLYIVSTHTNLTKTKLWALLPELIIALIVVGSLGTSYYTNQIIHSQRHMDFLFLRQLFIIGSLVAQTALLAIYAYASFYETNIKKRTIFCAIEIIVLLLTLPLAPTTSYFVNISIDIAIGCFATICLLWLFQQFHLSIQLHTQEEISIWLSE